MNTNWCTYCDNAVDVLSNSLYCSEECLRADALRNHPSLGYKFAEFVDFPRACSNKRPSPSLSSSTSSTSSSSSSSSSLSILRYSSSIPFPSNANLMCSSPVNMDFCSKYLSSSVYDDTVY